MNSPIKDNVGIILDEKSKYSTIKDSIDKIAVNFYQITNLAGKLKKAEHGTILPDGEALTPQTAAGCIFDYVRTTKFLRGIKKAIDFQLNTPGKKKIKIMYVGSGPHATLLFPLIPFYYETQLEISLIEFHQASVDSLKLLISHYGFKNYFDEILCDDAANYQHKKEYLYDIIIVETMQKALSVEPQVSITNHFSQYLAKDGVLIPEAIKISAVLADLHNELSSSSRKWTDFWLNIKRADAKNKRIFLKEIFVLDKNIRAKYDTLNLTDNRIILSTIPIQSRIGRMKNLILLTEIIIFDNVILSEEDETGLTKLYFDQNLEPTEEGKQIKFSYQLGSYPKFQMDYVSVG
jgi:hypothetical protein